MENGSWEHTVFFIGLRHMGNAPPIDRAMADNGNAPAVFLDYDEALAAANEKSERLGIRVEVFYAQLSIPFKQDTQSMLGSLLELCKGLVRRI